MYQKTTLDNGLRILTSAMPYTRSASVCIFIGVGSRYEAEAEAGASHFVEHMVFKGTTRRPAAREISAAIEGVGGTLNGGTDKEITVYWSKVAQPHLPLALDVLTDMLFHSRFDPQEIEKERRVIIEEINLSKDFPSQQVETLMDELLWPEHPLGRDTAGSKESVAAITREGILDYQRSRYLPANTVVAVAGGIQHQEVIAGIGQAMGDWANPHPQPRYSAYQEGPAPRLRIETRSVEQAHLCLGLPGLSLFHPRRFALDLLNVVLGEGMSSRLFAEIRDNLGLAYSIHSYVDHFLDSGAITIYAGVEPKNLRPALKAILEQLSRLRDSIPEAELSKAKELSKGRLLLRMEDSRNVAGWLGGQEVLMGQVLSFDQKLAIVDAVTDEDLRKVAQELVVDSQLRLAVVGPIADDEPLEELLKL